MMNKPTLSLKANNLFIYKIYMRVRFSSFILILDKSRVKVILLKFTSNLLLNFFVYFKYELVIF